MRKCRGRGSLREVKKFRPSTRELHFNQNTHKFPRSKPRFLFEMCKIYDFRTSMCYFWAETLFYNFPLTTLAKLTRR